MWLKQIVGVGMLLASSIGTAQASEIPGISLSDAIARGMQQNNRVKAAAFQTEAARSAASAAALHYLPSLTFEETWSRSNLPVNTFMMKLNQGRFNPADMNTLNNPAPVSDFKTSLTLEQPLLVPAAWAGKRAAGHGVEQTAAAAEQARQQTAFAIFQTYLAVHKAKAYLTASEKALQEARESRRQAGIRVAAGLGLRSDELRSSTHLAAMEQQHISATNHLTLARMQLALAVGGKPGEELDAIEGVQLKLPTQDLEQLLRTAQQERRDIKAVERGKDQADAALDQARSGFLPTVGVLASWQMNNHTTPFGNEHDAWMTGISLRWNLFDGFRTWHGSGQARAARAAATEQLEQARKDVGYQVHEAWLGKQEAEKRREVSIASVLSAEEAVRLLSKRFENALATMVELLDAQSALNQARASLVESEADVILATGRLYYTSGIFLKELQ